MAEILCEEERESRRQSERERERQRGREREGEREREEQQKIINIFEFRCWATVGLKTVPVGPFGLFVYLCWGSCWAPFWSPVGGQKQAETIVSITCFRGVGSPEKHGKQEKKTSPGLWPSGVLRSWASISCFTSFYRP